MCVIGSPSFHQMCSGDRANVCHASGSVGFPLSGRGSAVISTHVVRQDPTVFAQASRDLRVVQ